MVGTLAPTNLQGIMMGTWMLVSGVASTIAHYFSNIMIAPTNLDGDNINNYIHSFNVLGASALICSFILLLLIPKLNTLIGLDKVDNKAQLNCETA